MIVYCGVAILALLCIAGFLYEFLAKKYLHRKLLRLVLVGIKKIATLNLSLTARTALGLSQTSQSPWN